MKVFLSWANDESRQLAEIFEKWLKMILQSSKPWMSGNIEKGEAWDKEIHAGLDDTKIGILFLTKESIKSIYLHYEAGAIANVPESLVCTFLYKIKNTDVKQPLSRFQATKFEKEDVFKLVLSINSKFLLLGGQSSSETVLASLFEVLWPVLEAEIKAIESLPVSTSTAAKFNSTQFAIRSDRELLEEILETVRLAQNSKERVTRRVNEDMLKELARKFGNSVNDDLQAHEPEPATLQEVVNVVFDYLSLKKMTYQEALNDISSIGSYLAISKLPSKRLLVDDLKAAIKQYYSMKLS